MAEHPDLTAELDAAEDIVMGRVESVVTDRERLGRLVRETWVAWALEQPDAKPSWLVPWEELDDGQREVDMRIGEAVAVSVTTGR